jgi:hypothetical protein
MEVYAVRMSPSSPVSESLGKRENKPQAGILGLNLVHPRYPRSSTYFIRCAPSGGGAKLNSEVAERLKVQDAASPRRRVIGSRWSDAGRVTL